ncbi:mucin-2-like [Saccostrea echinata]|uniref:mucin-2-like n=1 Tax=Saccostrea echinata TaxID=191078 RepID=UPI002A812D66|nr:mucin-2-like [Saccostrea echinata]
MEDRNAILMKARNTKIPTLAAVYYPEEDATGVIPTNRILDISSCEVNAKVTIRWSKDTLLPARIIALSDSRQKLEEAIDNFEQDMDENDLDTCTALKQDKKGIKKKRTVKSLKMDSMEVKDKKKAKVLRTVQHPNIAIPCTSRSEDHPRYQLTTDLQAKINSLLNNTSSSVISSVNFYSKSAVNPVFKNSSLKTVAQPLEGITDPTVTREKTCLEKSPIIPSEPSVEHHTSSDCATNVAISEGAYTDSVILSTTIEDIPTTVLQATQEETCLGNTTSQDFMNGTKADQETCAEIATQTASTEISTHTAMFDRATIDNSTQMDSPATASAEIAIQTACIDTDSTEVSTQTAVFDRATIDNFTQMDSPATASAEIAIQTACLDTASKEVSTQTAVFDRATIDNFTQMDSPTTASAENAIQTACLDTASAEVSTQTAVFNRATIDNSTQMDSPTTASAENAIQTACLDTASAEVSTQTTCMQILTTAVTTQTALPDTASAETSTQDLYSQMDVTNNATQTSSQETISVEIASQTSPQTANEDIDRETTLQQTTSLGISMQGATEEETFATSRCQLSALQKTFLGNVIQSPSPTLTLLEDVTQPESSTPDPDVQNTSLPVLNLSDCFPELDDPYVERQHRMMRNVEDNHSALKQLQKSMDEIKKLLEKIVSHPVEANPSPSQLMQQSISTAAWTTISGRENIPACKSPPKKPETAAKAVPSSIFTNMDTLIAKSPQSSEQAATQALPTSIFTSIETLATSSDPNQKSISEATIHVAKSIFRSVDFLAASSCQTLSGLVPSDNSTTESQPEVQHQPETVDTLDFLEVRGDEIVERMSRDVDGPVDEVDEADKQPENTINDRSLDVDDSQQEHASTSLDGSKIIISKPDFWKMTIKSVISCGAKHVQDQGHILPEYEKNNPVFLELVEDIRGQKQEHRQKFATSLFRAMCTVEDVYKKNVNGRVFCGGNVEKAKVNPVKVKDIKEICFRCFPCTPAEEEKATRVIERTLNKVIWKFNKYLADHFDLTPILS